MLMFIDVVESWGVDGILLVRVRGIVENSGNGGFGFGGTGYCNLHGSPSVKF